MTDIINISEHFNLYYIIKEDKEKNSVSKQQIQNTWKKIWDRANNVPP